MEPKYLTIKEVFHKDDKYTIPIYQRNYAWEEPQIGQLLQDIFDVYKDINNYYLGSLIVYNKEGKYETIDGQQRLTTLNILACVLKAENIPFFNNVNVNLQFDSREKSNQTIQYFNDNGNADTSIKLHPQMKQAFDIIKRKLQELFGSKYYNSTEFNYFITYFLEKVKILRIQVPEETDLNHYFEVMNNRGEQLEKHEVLKASFLNILSKTNDSEKLRTTFNLIWNACSYMDRYVQYVFKIEYRVPLFGEFWNTPKFNSFTNICDKVEKIKSAKNTKTNNQTEIKPSFINIALGKTFIKPEEEIVNEEGLERFTPVTSFPHFLLQVLRITVDSKVQLDDKKLISQFKEHIFEKADALELTKLFAYNLLRIKFLFDNYIVKRDYNNDKEAWAILKMQKQNDRDIGYYTNTFGDNNSLQTKLVYLQSMFHVSFPQTNYKHWLSACLFFLNKTANITITSFINYLECLSDAFYFNRLTNTLDYHHIIFEKQGYIGFVDEKFLDTQSHLNIGTNVNNFIFNRLDYLLYYNIEEQKKLIEKENLDFEYNQFNINDFEFSFRSSVEHYAPQNPKNNDKPIANIDKFGNLCLISASKNSELSNYNPIAKKQHYKSSKSIESLKQRIMMCYKNWNETTVDQHQENMVALLNTKTVKI